MVRLTEQKFIDFGQHLSKYAGLSTDTKPDDAADITGSEFLEVDTGKTYYWDEEGDEWVDPTATT